MENDDFEPIFRYLATKGSLDLSEAIAKDLGEEFDRESVAKLSERVLEQTFSDLVSVLNLPPDEYAFKSGIYSGVGTFVALSSDGQPHIVMDMVFDFWLFATAHISTIVASHILEDDARKYIKETTDELFSLLIESNRFRKSREKYLPLLLDYKESLNLSSALARGMTIFVMCHEIAHCHLGHLDKPQSKSIELEADRLASEFFIRVVDAAPHSVKTTAYVDAKIAAAPIILMQLLSLYEEWVETKGVDISSVSSHPKAKDRTKIISEVILPRLDEKAAYILDGISKSLDDLKKLILA
ncbi:MAG: ImmA/IrrE family metallo-endopeptidase [Rhodobacteraceae bacterium]|nr:ImmA/IrrE family metallo-endopeptidase [Paracoccaceae bacterium]